MTEYIILRSRGTGENPDTWEQVEKNVTIKATSPKRALLVVEGLGEGTYVAVPKRSWKPLDVKIEKTTKVKIG